MSAGGRVPPLTWAVVVARWTGPVSVPVVLAFFDLPGAAVMMLVCLGITIMWRARLPAGLELVSVLTLLVAAWSSVYYLYERLAYWDLVVHAAATAVLAELGYRALRRWGRLAEPGPVAHVLLVLCLGTSLALLWEYLELAGYVAVDRRVEVGYLDTMTDLLAGSAGSLVAGVVGARSAVESDA